MTLDLVLRDGGAGDVGELRALMKRIAGEVPDLCSLGRLVAGRRQRKVVAGTGEHAGEALHIIPADIHKLLHVCGEGEWGGRRRQWGQVPAGSRRRLPGVHSTGQGCGQTASLAVGLAGVYRCLFRHASHSGETPAQPPTCKAALRHCPRHPAAALCDLPFVSALSPGPLCLRTDVSNNKLTQIPAEIASLSSLESLTFYHNLLTELPSLKPLQNLRSCNLRLAAGDVSRLWCSLSPISPCDCHLLCAF